jgi:hypothetical protein
MRRVRLHRKHGKCTKHQTQSGHNEAAAFGRRRSGGSVDEFVRGKREEVDEVVVERDGVE